MSCGLSSGCSSVSWSRRCVRCRTGGWEDGGSQGVVRPKAELLPLPLIYTAVQAERVRLPSSLLLQAVVTIQLSKLSNCTLRQTQLFLTSGYGKGRIWNKSHLDCDEAAAALGGEGEGGQHWRGEEDQPQDPWPNIYRFRVGAGKKNKM